jgi:myo-inositol 2-dehydrogenase/D-chiro-inositol 1-dehydrogenase
MDKLKLGLIGLGRMGQKYAEIIDSSVKNASIIAVCSIHDKELDYAKYKLDVPYTFRNHQQLLELNELDAVMVLSSTLEHAIHMTDSLNAGYHVFCEKPLALSVEDCHKVLKVADSKPSQIAIVGFNRRFDKSYVFAKQKIEEGLIGKPFLVRSQTVDKDSQVGFQQNYVQKSGGIFMDYNVHDIDLARWYLDTEFHSVYALGGSYKHQVFEQMNDADNVLTVGRMKNNTMVQLIASRTAAHGHDTYCEITGTEGTLRIGRPAGKNLVEIYDKNGSRREIVDTFLERFEESFVSQTQSFVNHVIEGKKMSVTLKDALEATRVGVAMTKSFMLKKEIVIDR